ncbi:MAG: hypothetical protein E7409_05220 [Ruminococcaceae bacterium]|nr:hypothetical protein [Oscillospiraceae bacterium]
MVKIAGVNVAKANIIETEGMGMKKWIAMALALCMCVFGTVIASAQNEPLVPILLYHNIAEQYPMNDAALHITPEQFYAHMDAVKGAGYQTVTLSEFYEYCKGNGTLPENPIIITFDDGYQSNYDYAYPYLTQMGMRATIFVITERMGDHTVTYPHFDWNAANEMQASGVIEIQCHSHTHPNFSTLTKEQTIREMRLSRFLIEQNMGIACRFFAYPYGIENEYSTKAAVDAGYTVVNMVGDRGANSRYTDLLHLRRLTVPGDMTAEELLSYIEQNKY